MDFQQKSKYMSINQKKKPPSSPEYKSLVKKNKQYVIEQLRQKQEELKVRKVIERKEEQLVKKIEVYWKKEMGVALKKKMQRMH